MNTNGHNGFLLGSVRLVQAGQSLQLNSRKALGLLGYLAQQGRPIQRELLIELLWSEDDAPGARGSMRTLLKNLRQQLGGAFYADRQIVALEQDTIAWDIDRFSALAAEDDIAAWVQASALYQGEFMHGFQLEASYEFDDWLETTRHFWFDAVNRVLRKISDYYLHHDQAEKALAYTRRWLELEPWQEKAHRQQMWLHWQLGDFESALAQYERCAARLMHDLDIEPSDQTQELYDLILTDQSKHQWQDVHNHVKPITTTPAPPTPTSPPRHQDAPAHQQTDPTRAAKSTYKNNANEHNTNEPTHVQADLWIDDAFKQRYALSHIVGRKRELSTLQQALQQYRLVSVLGLAGVGKSRLVYELLFGTSSTTHTWANTEKHVLNGATLTANDLNTALEHIFSQHTFTGKGEVVTSEIIASGTTASTTASSAIVNADREHPADPTKQPSIQQQPVLLVIDGLTELLTDMREALISQLAAQPRLRVLVTARFPLELKGEKRMRLFGLEHPTRHTPWQQARHMAALRLFAEQAHLYVPDFTLDASNTAVAAELCRVVSGLPFALEHLASWLNVMPVQALQQQLLELANNPYAADDWLTTLLEASWQSLDPQLRGRYAACAVMADGFDAHAARAITGLTMPQLHTLVDRSLLEVMQGRYYMPQIFRQRLLYYLNNVSLNNKLLNDRLLNDVSQYGSSDASNHIRDVHDPDVRITDVRIDIPVGEIIARQAVFYVTRLALPGALTAADESNVQRAWYYVCSNDTHLLEQSLLQPTPPLAGAATPQPNYANLLRYLPALMMYYRHFGSWQTLEHLLEHTWQHIDPTGNTATDEAATDMAIDDMDMAFQLELLAYLSYCALMRGDAHTARDYLEQAYTQQSLVVAATSTTPAATSSAATSPSPDRSIVSPAAAWLAPITRHATNNVTSHATSGSSFTSTAHISQASHNIDVSPTQAAPQHTNTAVSEKDVTSTDTLLTNALNTVLFVGGIYAFLTGDSDAAAVHFQEVLEQPHYQLLARFWLADLALQEGQLPLARQWQHDAIQHKAIQQQHSTRPITSVSPYISPEVPSADMPPQGTHSHSINNSTSNNGTSNNGTSNNGTNNNGTNNNGTNNSTSNISHTSEQTAAAWLLALRLEQAAGHRSNAKRYLQRLTALAEHNQRRDLMLAVHLYGAALQDDPRTALEQAFVLAQARANHVSALTAANAWLWSHISQPTNQHLTKQDTTIPDTAGTTPQPCHIQHYVMRTLEHPDLLPKTSLLIALAALAALNLQQGHHNTAQHLVAYVIEQPATPHEVRHRIVAALEVDVPDTLEVDVLTLLPAALDNLTPCG